VSTFRAFATAAILLAAPLGTAQAGDHVAPLTAFAKEQIASWVQSDIVVNAIKAQNQKNAGLTQADIDKLDKQWRSETSAGGGSLINRVLANDLSKYLKDIKAKAGGVFTEIFVMDNKGLNVGQSDVTSDYWQGDEGKWKNTYGKGPGAIDIGEIEQDESTQAFQSQISMTVVDPSSGEPIGAVTVGVNVDEILN